MTGEEMERAIEFLLRNQASFDARMDRLEAAQGRTQQHIDHLTTVVASLAEREERNRDDINILARLVNTMVEGRNGGS